MSRNRKITWLALLALLPSLVIAIVLGLWAYSYTTAKVLHPNPQGVTSVTNAAPAPKWAGAAERGRQIARAGLSEQNLPGLSVAVGVNGDIAWAEGFGWANLEDEIPVSPDTLFRIGTASTVLTSAAAGLLLEQGRLKLDEKIQTYVPAFPEKAWPVTLGQVMGHLAGIKSDGGDEGPLFSQPCERPVDALRHFRESALTFEPGTQYRFSRYGWILVSAAIEAAAGEPFLSFMHQQVFEPLGLNHTEPDSDTEPSPDRATPYFPRFGSDPLYGLHLMRPLHYSCYAGSSVFLSTPSDLARFAMAVNSGKLLQRATVQSLQTSQRLPSGEETGYGLGWDLETVTLAGQQTRTAGHDGDVLGGRVASLLTFPDHGLVVAVVTNISYADTFALAVKIAEAFAEQQKSPGRK